RDQVRCSSPISLLRPVLLAPRLETMPMEAGAGQSKDCEFGSQKLHTAPMTTFAWDDLRHFLAFARAGSMQAAAKILGVNQSTVQRRIADLEECVGKRLVERHLSSYRLTALGEELLSAAVDVESAVAAFERRLAVSDKGLI